MSNDPYQSQEPPYEQPFYEYASTDGRPIGYGPPPFSGIPPMPPYPPQPTKKPYRRLWITLGIVGIVLLVLTCGGCVTTSFFSFRFIQQNIGPALITTQYYGALKVQKYDLAYSYVDANAIVQGQRVSLEAFTRLAQTADTSEGKVTLALASKFTETNNTATVIMQITRNRQTYPVTLKLKREGNDWQITNANRL